MGAEEWERSPKCVHIYKHRLINYNKEESTKMPLAFTDNTQNRHMETESWSMAFHTIYNCLFTNRIGKNTAIYDFNCITHVKKCSANSILF